MLIGLWEMNEADAFRNSLALGKPCALIASKLLWSGRLTTEKLMEITGISSRSLGAKLSDMAREGLVVRVADEWALTDVDLDSVAEGYGCLGRGERQADQVEKERLARDFMLRNSSVR